MVCFVSPSVCTQGNHVLFHVVVKSSLVLVIQNKVVIIILIWPVRQSVSLRALSTLSASRAKWWAITQIGMYVLWLSVSGVVDVRAGTTTVVVTGVAVVLLFRWSILSSDRPVRLG